MLISEIIQEDGPTQGCKAYCKNTPIDNMRASWMSSCKARGYITRTTKKTQKVGNKRKKVDGIAKSEKYGGWVSPTKTG